MAFEISTNEKDIIDLVKVCAFWCNLKKRALVDDDSSKLLSRRLAMLEYVYIYLSLFSQWQERKL